MVPGGGEQLAYQGAKLSHLWVRSLDQTTNREAISSARFIPSRINDAFWQRYPVDLGVIEGRQAHLLDDLVEKPTFEFLDSALELFVVHGCTFPWRAAASMASKTATAMRSTEIEERAANVESSTS